MDKLISFFEGERREADDARKPFEAIWLEGYRAYNNQYPSTQKFRPGGSQVYYGLTRAKCNAAWAREVDILFSRPQMPWQIEPTPNPTVPIKRVVDFILEKIPPEIRGQIESQGISAMMEIVPKEVFDKAEQALATDAMKQMSRQIEDSMVEDRTLVKVRNAMLEKVITGTTIMKFGTCERHVSSWATGTDGYCYDPQTELSPTVKHVSVFDVWFDPNARLLIDNGTIQSCSYVYERYQMGHAELRSLAELRSFAGKPLFNRDAIIKLLDDGADGEETQADIEMRDIWGGQAQTKVNQFDVYERTGTLTIKQLREIGAEVCEEADDNDVMNMSVWYCRDQIIKVVTLPDKVTRLPYMVVPQELAPGQLYGVGIPWKMRNGQALLNATVRLFIDCKANAAGPITFYNADVWNDSDNLEDLIQPWASIPLKVPSGLRLQDVVKFELIPDVGDQLQSLLQLVKHQCDEESQVPAFSHAAQSNDLTRATGGTSSGMAMIMGMADLAHKMAVQNVDDFFIVPCLTMYYNWFMQFGENEDAKGDMKVYALGTIGVMKKEILGQRLTQLITQTSNPVDAQIFNRQQLWLDAVDALDLDAKKYMVQGMPGAPPSAPQPAPPGMPQTMGPPQQ